MKRSPGIIAEQGALTEALEVRLAEKPGTPDAPVVVRDPYGVEEAKANDAKANADAFSMLMTSHKENEAWKEADAVEDKSVKPTKANGGRRKAPFYKIMQGMPIAVDAFRYGAIPGVKAYFLT